MPASKGAFGRRRSVDSGSNTTKKSFLGGFRRRSKDQVEQNSHPKSTPTSEKKKLTLEEVSKIRPVVNVSKPIVCHTSSKPMKNHASTSVLELSESPKRRSYGQVYYNSRERLSVTPPPGPGDDDFIHKCPSSPLLVAVRTAVDSLSQYNDFDILEKIGSGFYAEVFKVSEYVHCVAIGMYIDCLDNSMSEYRVFCSLCVHE